MALAQLSLGKRTIFLFARHILEHKGALGTTPSLAFPFGGLHQMTTGRSVVNDCVLLSSRDTNVICMCSLCSCNCPFILFDNCCAVSCFFFSPPFLPAACPLYLSPQLALSSHFILRRAHGNNLTGLLRADAIQR